VSTYSFSSQDLGGWRVLLASSGWRPECAAEPPALHRMSIMLNGAEKAEVEDA